MKKSKVKAAAEQVPTLEIPAAKFTIRPLPAEPFYAGVLCKSYPDGSFRLELGEARVVLIYSGASWKIRLTVPAAHGLPERTIQRSLGAQYILSGIEGAVCFLRALNRGEVWKIANRYHQ